MLVLQGIDHYWKYIFSRRPKQMEDFMQQQGNPFKLKEEMRQRINGLPLANGTTSLPTKMMNKQQYVNPRFCDSSCFRGPKLKVWDLKQKDLGGVERCGPFACAKTPRNGHLHRRLAGFRVLSGSWDLSFQTSKARRNKQKKPPPKKWASRALSTRVPFKVSSEPKSTEPQSTEPR